MSAPRDLPGPLDLTDRHVLACWLTRVREHVTELDKLLRAVPPMPFLHVEVYGAPSNVPTATLQSEATPSKTMVVRLERQTERDVVVSMPNGEIRRFSRRTGTERREASDLRPPSGWRLVLPVKPPGAEPNAPDSSPGGASISRSSSNPSGAIRARLELAETYERRIQ